MPQMLKVNVGLSRKVSRDYNSTGFSINLEGEVCAPLDDPEQLIEKVQELYDLAEESLNLQVSRYESDSAIASRDAESWNDNDGVGRALRALRHHAIEDGNHAGP